MLHPPRLRWLRAACWIAGFTSMAARPGWADDRPVPPAGPAEAAQGAALAVAPLPPVAIPDNPPPHEGALIDLCLVIEPPDIIVVEVLEALPGRPITGERLVRPDGTVSLGFYGDVHVRGLTTAQAKVKIIHHLRTYLNDHALGLTYFVTENAEIQPLPRPGTKVKSTDIDFFEPNRHSTPPPKDEAKSVDPAPTKPDAESAPKAERISRRAKQDRKKKQRAATRAVVARPADELRQDPPQPARPAEAAMEEAEEMSEAELVYLDPAASKRVFVDFGSYNSKVYFVQGDVGKPGRLPFAGRETVLDALNFSGGLIPTANAGDIHLYRPARGGQPAHDYLIDYEGILKGKSQANLQLFPDDRLVVGRNAIVQKTIEIDRATALTATIFTSFNQLNTALRSINPGQTTTESRLGLADWFDSFWRGVADDPAILNDPARFRSFVAGSLERTRRPR